MKSIHAASKFELFQELSASEMVAVEGGNKIVQAINNAITAAVGFIVDLLLAHPYCVGPMITGKPCI